MNPFYHSIYLKAALLLCVYTVVYAGGEPSTEQIEPQEPYALQEQGQENFPQEMTPNTPYGPQAGVQQPQLTQLPAPRLSYKPKMVNFEKAPRQGKLSLAGMLTQIGANTLGQMGVNDGDRTMVKIATGLQGMGQAMSTINATRDPWGRMKGGLQNQKTYYDKQGNFRPQYQKQNQQFMQGMNAASGRGNNIMPAPVQIPQNIVPNTPPQNRVQPSNLRPVGIKKQIVPQKTVEQTVAEKKENKQGSDNYGNKIET